MKKILMGALLLASLTLVGCSEEELPKIGPDKDIDQVEEPVKEEEVVEEEQPIVEQTPEESICEQLTVAFDMSVTFDGYQTFIMRTNKTMNDFLGDGNDPVKVADGTTEVLTTSKMAYDMIDELYEGEFYFMYNTSDNNNVSIFKTSDGTYYTNCFGVTINNIYEWVK